MGVISKTRRVISEGWNRDLVT